MNSTTPAGSDRQLHRNKGLARISALTLGAGAASLVGAVAIAVTLPGSTVVSALQSSTASTLTSGSTAAGNDDSTSSGSGDDGSTSVSQAQAQAQARAQTQTQAQSQLQSGTAPTTTNRPPAATSGAS
ncbi:MAG: hypothetical protein ABI899_02480 [Actinomycetota bacterium]